MLYLVLDLFDLQYLMLIQYAANDSFAIPFSNRITHKQSMYANTFKRLSSYRVMNIKFISGDDSVHLSTLFLTSMYIAVRSKVFTYCDTH